MAITISPPPIGSGVGVNDLTDMSDVDTAGATDGQVLTFDSTGSDWNPEDAVPGTTVHGNLTSLSADDHTQYFNTTRHDANTEHVNMTRFCVLDTPGTDYEQYDGSAIPANTAGVHRHFLGDIDPTTITTVNENDTWADTSGL